MSLINADVLARLMQQKKNTKPVTVPNSTTTPTMANTGAVGSLAGVTVPKATPSITAPSTSSGVTIPNGFSATNYSGSTTGITSTNSGVTVPRTEQTLNSQASLVNTPWQYNAANDQSLQAAIRDADNKLAINQKNTNAQLRATGQGKSSYSETVANQLANQSAENIANTLVPQYESLAYQKNQDQIGNLRNLYQDYNQQDFQNPITESATTGIYQNAATKDALNKIMMYKAEAEGPNITAARRAELNKLADQQRAIIDANGGDSTKLGANVKSNNINQTGIGVRTLAGQNQDLAAQNQTFNQNLSTRQQDFNEGITMADLTGSINGKATTSEQQRQLTNLWTVADQTGTIPDALADMYGIARGTQTQSAKQFAAQLAVSKQNANSSSNSASNSIANSQFNQLMDIWQATGTAPAGLEAFGVKSGTSYTAGAAAKAAEAVTAESYATSYLDKAAQYEDGELLNADAIEKSILESGLTAADMKKLYLRYGIPLPSGN